MKRFALLTTVFTAVLTLVLPFVGGSGPALLGSSSTSAQAGTSITPIFASPVVATSEGTASVAANIAAFTSRVPSSIAQNAASIKAAASATAATTVDTEHLAQKPVPKPAPPVVEAASGGSNGSPSRGASTTAQRRAAAAASGGGCPGNVGGGVSGNADLASFAVAYNAIRVANCLQPVPMSHFRYDSCMEQRLQWMANDPSLDPNNTWGHAGVRSLNPDANGQYYSVIVPSVGCDGNLAGGTGNSGATVAQKWWDSLSHRASLYRPTFTGNTANVCINFAMVHGGLPNDGYGFTRAAARWVGC